MSEETRQIRATLAEVPTDVLTYLVDHDPASLRTIADAVAPPDAKDAYWLVDRALSLLRELGWARFDAYSATYLWFATVEGKAAVEQARHATSERV